jgi:hypothetical protein
VGDAAGIDHMAEQAEVGQVKPHASFAFCEGRLSEIQIAS